MFDMESCFNGRPVCGSESKPMEFRWMLNDIFYRVFDVGIDGERRHDDSIERRVKRAYTKRNRDRLESEAGYYWEEAKKITEMEKEEFVKKLLTMFDERKPEADRQYKSEMFYILDSMPKSVIEEWTVMNTEIKE